MRFAAAYLLHHSLYLPRPLAENPRQAGCHGIRASTTYLHLPSTPPFDALLPDFRPDAPSSPGAPAKSPVHRTRAAAPSSAAKNATQQRERASARLNKEKQRINLLKGVLAGTIKPARKDVARMRSPKGIAALEEELAGLQAKHSRAAARTCPVVPPRVELCPHCRHIKHAKPEKEIECSAKAFRELHKICPTQLKYDRTRTSYAKGCTLYAGFGRRAVGGGERFATGRPRKRAGKGIIRGS